MDLEEMDLDLKKEASRVKLKMKTNKTKVWLFASLPISINEIKTNNASFQSSFIDRNSQV